MQHKAYEFWETGRLSILHQVGIPQNKRQATFLLHLRATALKIPIHTVAPNKIKLNKTCIQPVC